MANFTFEKYNSLPEQVEENKENIKKLCGYIKDAYHTNEGVVLNTASISVAKSLTNADQDVVDGWLFDSVGSFFKITCGDEYALLIEFYTSFKGEDGRDGADDIDDNVIANNKLWSSDKTYTEIGNAKDKGIYFTTTEPSLIDTDVYALDQMLLGNADFLHIPVKISDLIIYIDSNNNPTAIYKVNNISSNILSLSKVGEFSKGKQLYQHNISYSRSVGSVYLRYDILEITEDNTEINTRALFKQWLLDRGYTALNPRKTNGGFYYDGSNWNATVSIYLNTSNQIEYYYFTGSSNQSGTDVSESGTLTDQVKPL